ncbi:MAG TPA: cation:proton antiporter [Pyrinomonadaceae bacterium]|nr:cation:proton antiporter [Pyrinomonadaceae bacterium]
MPMPVQSGYRFSDLRHYLPYVLLLILFVGGVWAILSAGSHLESGTRAATVQSTSAITAVTTGLHENFRNPLSILLLQIIVIIAIAGLFSRIFRRLRQPPVMGEMVAGIVMGPSVLGFFFPEVMAFIFPPSSLETLRLLSQIGVVLFMFVVGMELNVRHVREKGSAAVMISHASIIVPFLLGTGLSLFLYRELAPPETSFTAFALFIGVAMSITAFPVLARILEDRGMTHTFLGSIALTCAAVDDVTAWCILALVIALVKATGVTVSIATLLFTLLFALGMLFVVRPQLGRMVKEVPSSTLHSRRLIAGMLALVLACALLTETIGIHALFGAFIAGIVMPSSIDFRVFLRDKIETFSSAALLPLFFAFTGLRTQISSLNDWQSWALCGVIILVAIVGKLVGSMLMSRWTGMSWSNSFAIGALMNTRGLVELVVLNIGYDLGILSGRIFAMMVLMALVTTFMTGPLLSLVRTEQRAREVAEAI